MLEPDSRLGRSASPRFHPKEPNFMSTNGIPLPELADGAPLDHEMFPDLTASR